MLLLRCLALTLASIWSLQIKADEAIERHTQKLQGVLSQGISGDYFHNKKYRSSFQIQSHDKSLEMSFMGSKIIHFLFSENQEPQMLIKSPESPNGVIYRRSTFLLAFEVLAQLFWQKNNDSPFKLPFTTESHVEWEENKQILQSQFKSAPIKTLRMNWAQSSEMRALLSIEVRDQANNLHVFLVD